MTAATRNAMEIKLSNVFKAFDQNGNGYLEAEDFQIIVQALASEFGVQNSPRHFALATAYNALWGELLRHSDTNQDGRISLDEFIANGQQAIADSSRINVVDYLGSSVFEVVDANGDGYVDREEFARLQRAFRATGEGASETFDAIDADGDGRMSHSEFLQGVRDYFTSPHYDKPGSWFFGKPA